MSAPTPHANSNATPNATPNAYLKAKVFTATPEQLQMMLYDGAVRFAEQGRAALERKDWEAGHGLLVKAQKIVIELTCGLKRDMDRDLCQKLAGLYNFAYMKLVEANVHHDVAAVDDALGVLKYQRQTWSLLLEQIAKSKAATVARTLAFPAPDQRMEGALRLSA